VITSFDDYPIHQTAEPIAHPAPTDRNFYDRYWFNGFDKKGELYFGASLGLYPNREVMDCGFSVLCGKEQHSFHASRRAPADRAELRVGPLSLEVVRPMRELRLRLAPNDTGIEADLVFRAKTIAHEEQRNHLWEDSRLMLDTSSFVQYGSWQGHLKAGGERVEVRYDTMLGTRDRSWGVRPVGEPVRGVTPRREPGIYLLWSFNHFDDCCVHYQTFQEHGGAAIMAGGALLPVYGSPEQIPSDGDAHARAFGAMSHVVEWRKGTRWASAARLSLAERGAERHELTVEPLLRFHMKGIGYQHPKWGHGSWQGEEVIAGEKWNVDELDPLTYDNLHVQQICRVRMGDRVGMGALEQLVIGSHRPSGLKGMLDGAP